MSHKNLRVNKYLISQVKHWVCFLFIAMPFQATSISEDFPFLMVSRIILNKCGGTDDRSPHLCNLMLFTFDIPNYAVWFLCKNFTSSGSKDIRIKKCVYEQSDQFLLFKMFLIYSYIFHLRMQVCSKIKKSI